MAATRGACVVPQVCIETVLAYRTKRGFREQPVMSEWQDLHEPSPEVLGF